MVLIDITYRVCECEYFVDAVKAFESLCGKVQQVIDRLAYAAVIVFENIVHLLVVVERFLECVDEIIDIGSRWEPSGYAPRMLKDL